MWTCRLVLLLATALFVSSCAPRNDIAVDNTSDTATLESSSGWQAQATREAVFTYTENLPSSINLILHGEPVLLNNVYLRLTGMVGGMDRVVLIEVGGKGVVAEAGKEINGYRVMKISDDGVKLERRR
jgi:hypothetical protein